MAAAKKTPPKPPAKKSGPAKPGAKPSDSGKELPPFLQKKTGKKK